MISFETLRARAAARKGGDEALTALMPAVKTPAELAAIGDDRWLSMISRCVFQAGFSWTVVEKKWPGFETAFWGFDPGRCRAMDDEAFDALLKDTRIIRNGAKVRSVQLNAALLMDLAAAHGSAGACFAAWPAEDYVGLLEMLKKRGDRLAAGPGRWPCGSWAGTAGCCRRMWSRRWPGPGSSTGPRPRRPHSGPSRRRSTGGPKRAALPSPIFRGRWL